VLGSLTLLPQSANANAPPLADKQVVNIGNHFVLTAATTSVAVLHKDLVVSVATVFNINDVITPKLMVTYWAERIGPLVDHIIQVSRSAAFGAIPKTSCYSLNISRLAACIWIIFLSEKV